MRTLNDKIAERSRNFLKEILEEQRLKIIMKLQDEIDFDLETLELKEITVGKKPDTDEKRVFTTFVHKFLLNGTYEIEIDILEPDANTSSIAQTDCYMLTYDRFNGSDVYKDSSTKDLGLSVVLEFIDYHNFFFENYDEVFLLKKISKDSDAKILFNLVKDSYPGLVKIKHSEHDDDYVLTFSTGAALTASMNNIEAGHFKALKQKYERNSK